MLVNRFLLAAGLFAAGCTETTSGTDPSGAIVIAHRGASHDAPEHTTAAYDQAVEDGADYVELDVARTRDGVLVVIHDSSLDRTARGSVEDCRGEVREKTHAQLLRCDFGVWFNEQNPSRARESYRGLKILTLNEAITRYRADAGIYIEIKNPELYPGIEAEVSALLRMQGFFFGPSPRPPVFVSSFSPGSLKLLHDLEPALPLVLLLGSAPIQDVEQLLESATPYAVGLGLPAGIVSEPLILAAHDCMFIHVYGGDARMSEMIGMRVDGMFVDQPRMLRAIVDASKISLTTREFSC